MPWVLDCFYWPGLNVIFSRKQVKSKSSSATAAWLSWFKCNLWSLLSENWCKKKPPHHCIWATAFNAVQLLTMMK